VSLALAVRGRVSQPTLAEALAPLSGRDDRGEAAKALRPWLVERANERELPARRRAGSSNRPGLDRRGRRRAWVRRQWTSVRTVR
jgi:hypothetical protein